MNQIQGRKPNQLAAEKSPYLLQHQFNPVDWRPWGQDAFEKARQENKPIFLSIGYSTCHWCHVMERESFEDEQVAELLNRDFVSIKVDREERPDVDKIYMTAVQLMTGQGGWPLNIFLTPDLRPFYGGTYFPPSNKYGRPGFAEIVTQVAHVWRDRKGDVLDSATQLHQQLEQIAAARQAPGLVLNPGLLENGARQFKAEYDPQHGGFSRAPKFPRPSEPSFLLRYAVRQKDRQAIDMVLHTCEAMAQGGMYDQLGGGFSRYSVDEKWLVPHFEKMLYDNAQLAQLYLDAFLISGKEVHARIVRETLRYVLRDMTHPEGGFYSAEDADSEGKEGKFYCWTLEELEKLLGPDELAAAVKFFGITLEGNFLDHSDPEPLPAQNVLSVQNDSLTAEERASLEMAKTKMLAERSKRVRPHLDDKILSSWNGLMLGAFARASAILGEDEFARAATRNFEFLRRHLWDGSSGTLFHRWRSGERDKAQLLESYADLLSGALDWYEAGLDASVLEFTVELADAMLSRFYDPEAGGFWQAPPGASDLILRIKEDYDGAEPSGNSVACLSLLRLAHITGRREFLQAAENTLRYFSERMQTLPQAVPHMLSALQFWLVEPKRIVISGERNAAFASLLKTAHSVYEPHKIMLGTLGPVDELARRLPAGRTAAHVCTADACLPPVQTGDELRKILQGSG